MTTELRKEASYDEDGYSAAAREDTSVRGVLSPSDWGSTFGASVFNDGGGADSTVVVRQNTPSEANKEVESNKKNKNDPTTSKKRNSWKLFQWWSDLISRASRSATSLLNQHSPNLNDILDGNEENPLAAVDERRRVAPSIPEDNDEVLALREEVAILKKRIEEMENETKNNADSNCTLHLETADDIPSMPPIQMLQPDQISRYSRQLLLNDGFGVSGQKQLLSSSILVVGAGGIGSTVLLYLAAAGVGHITVVDYDCVEMTNLHRQIIHKDSNASGVTDSTLGLNKALSAKLAMLDLNPSISCTALDVMITGENALELVSKHDVVVDACDNPRTRYLLNDACILGGKPLVSGSAMGTEGQLTVYNYQPKQSDPEVKKKQSACYRCLYPKQVLSEGCKSCSDNGVLGPVPGIIGTLQAVEAIKVVTGIGNVMHDRLLMYDSLHCSFLNIKKPPQKKKCAVCSSAETTTIKSMKDSAESLEQVRGPSVCALPNSNGLSPKQNISCDDYNNLRDEGKPHVLLDVRVTRQYEMCSLEGSVNLPLEELESKIAQVEELSNGELPVYCLCRRGIASAEAVKILQKAKDDDSAKGIHSVYNISGGLNSWVANVDLTFPSY